MAESIVVSSGEVVDVSDVFSVVPFIDAATKDWTPDKRVALLREVEAMFDGDPPAGLEAVFEPQGPVAIASPASLDLLRARGCPPSNINQES